MRKRNLALVLGLLVSSKFAISADILTATPATHILTSSLVEETSLDVKYLLPARYGVQRLESWLSSKGKDSLYQEAQKATAMVTLKSIWPQDTSFNHARHANIRLIQIDASQSLSHHGGSVAALTNSQGEVSIYSWMNPNNLSRMSKIIADDLVAIWPEHAEQIQANLQTNLIKLRQLTQSQSQILFDKQVESAILLSESLEDFAAGYQLFVEDRLYQPEIDWTSDTYRELKRKLAQDPSLFIITDRKISRELSEQIAASRILQVDSLERMGRLTFDNKSPFQRWVNFSR
ncbi:metal ABC transporter solute-binding protein, Zn/Mn family [Vibrio europaeus]|uniref:metal ABC transporter solute-binding protein, Zn/Mn family n=1 Tax=Vibrio europaeus TaxID=300876 RepID=UPI00233ECB6A|nr:zinc ABC transporter substrate-binding protein [Vibrio europaeus]MDC5855557.1 zinc ABC transporter substrate-binding protein [Vibrio europaeus]